MIDQAAALAETLAGTQALLFCAAVLMRAQEFERSLGALSEAHDLLEPAVHGWLLAVHDCMMAENLMLLGQFDDAEPAARSSAERFDAQGEVWFSAGPLNIQAGIAAARGDLDEASAAYEALLEPSSRRLDAFLRPWAPPSTNRKSKLQISSWRLTSVSPQRRVRPARQTGIHAATTRSALQPA